MAENIKFRDLKANEINVRIAMVKDTEKSKGVSLLLYKDARCDANILDETVGSENWVCKFYECKGNLFCSLGIRNPNSNTPFEFIYKDDCGSESYTEKEKGEASDAFKRAGFKWGIGRELYTSPFIWVKGTDCNIKNGKCCDTFHVKHIRIEDKKITELVIFNDKTKKDCFSFGLPKAKQTETETLLKADIERLIILGESKGVTADKLCKKYKVKSLMSLTPEQYENCRKGLMGM